MATCVGCKAEIRKGARFCPRCGLSGPTNTLSGSSLLLILVVFAAVAFALTATQLGII
jgi:predicted amidophosphoribosyltransferase